MCKLRLGSRRDVPLCVDTPGSAGPRSRGYTGARAHQRPLGAHQQPRDVLDLVVEDAGLVLELGGCQPWRHWVSRCMVAVDDHSGVRVWRIVLESSVVEVWMIVGHGGGLGQYGEDPLPLLHPDHYCWFPCLLSTEWLSGTFHSGNYYILLLSTQIKDIHCL